MIKIALPFLALAAAPALADEAIPLPFEGLFESRGGMAREQFAPGEWRDIPQDVRMRITRKDGTVEVSLRIEAQFTEPGSAQEPYTIANEMWLVPKAQAMDAPRPARTELDVYKLDRGSGRFEDRGDGYCREFECRYSYVTTKPNYRQRYHSHLTWEPDGAGSAFYQSGGLSIRPDGESEWTTVKTWDNRFVRSR